uniref:Uncharacterized protein n=1 Tax=Knipowitschia caucasica TaxID=637954 RepID=A0AAV2L2B7_KNICA
MHRHIIPNCFSVSTSCRQRSCNSSRQPSSTPVAPSTLTAGPAATRRSCHPIKRSSVLQIRHDFTLQHKRGMLSKRNPQNQIDF